MLAAVPVDLPIQVEVKSYAAPELAERTARAVCGRYRGAAARSQIEVISFHSAAVAVAAAHGSGAAGDSRRLHARGPGGVGGCSGVSRVSIEHFLLSPQLASVMRLAGLSVNTGTVNDAELLLRVIELAAPDAVGTDRPAELRAEARALAASPTSRAAAAAA